MDRTNLCGKSFLVIALMMLFLVCGGAFAEEKVALTSTLDDQTATSLTVYNANIGLVKEKRNVNLQEGTTELRFMDVASKIIPASVYIKSSGKDFKVLEQNYEYDLMTPQKLLEKQVGKEIRLYYKSPYTDKEETVNATLLSYSGEPIFKIGNEITIGLQGKSMFMKMPETLISRPALVWLVKSRKSKQELEVSYLTDDISWKADYIFTVNEKEDRLDISGWVTIDNRSGAAYKEAKLVLIAGDINRVREEPRTRRVMAAQSPAAAPQFKEEGLFEYHQYTLERPATIKNNQAKQISFLSASDVPVKKEYVLRGENYYYFNRYPEKVSAQKVGVQLEVINEQKNNLGIPLPKGTVRAYKTDISGSIQFIGESQMDHSPKGERIRTRVGDAFDIVAGRKQTDWKKISSDVTESAYEISLRNHKKETVVVKVIEPIPGDWTIINASHEYTKTDAANVEFSVPVLADSETKLLYKVRIKQ